MSSAIHTKQTHWKQRLFWLSLCGLVVTGGGWIWTSAIAPPAVHAYVARADVTVDVQGGESFSTFLSRAENVARAAVQRSFDRDILISELYVVIVGQRQGLSAPVLQVRVSRNQWRSRPDPRRWATYFSSARFLLGFNAPAKTPTPTASPSPSPSPIQSRPDALPSEAVPPGTPPGTAPGSAPGTAPDAIAPPPPTTPAAPIASPTTLPPVPTTPLPPQ